MIAVSSFSRADTCRLGSIVAASLRAGDTVVLTGELGGGKTAFVCGAVQGLGSVDFVSSPTYAIVQEYDGPIAIAHADLYRIESSRELFDIGFEELFDGTRIVFVEWGDRAQDVLPDSYLHVSLRHCENPDQREVTIAGEGSDWQSRIVVIATAVRATEGFQLSGTSQ